MAWKTSSQAWRIGIYKPFLINYVFRKRTLNHYWAITTRAWREILHAYEDTPYEKWVYSCGKIEGEAGTSACRHCGNYLREYYATLERMRKGE